MFQAEATYNICSLTIKAEIFTSFSAQEETVK